MGATKTGGGELGDPEGDRRLGGVAVSRGMFLDGGGGPVGVHGFLDLLRAGSRRGCGRCGVAGGVKSTGLTLGETVPACVFTDEGEGLHDGARTIF